MTQGPGDLETSNPSQQATSPSLLAGVRLREAEAWRRLVRVYAPLVRYWCRQAGAAEAEVDDVAQEAFTAVLRGLPSFERRSDGGSFRGWLRTIVRNKLTDHFRARRHEAAAAGGTEAHLRIGAVPDRRGAASADGEADAATQREATETGLVFRAAVEMIRTEFEATTAQAFWLTTVDGRPPADVATELGVSLNAVYKAKSRVLRRLREVLEGLEE